MKKINEKNGQNYGFDFEKLTEREQEITQLVLEGLSNREIAGKLYLSIMTIKAELENIFRKSCSKNRVVLAVKYFKYLASLK